jgi:hypothetical protein
MSQKWKNTIIKYSSHKEISRKFWSNQLSLASCRKYNTLYYNFGFVQCFCPQAKTFRTLIVVLLRKASKVVSGHDKLSPRQSRETFLPPCLPRVKRVRKKFPLEGKKRRNCSRNRAEIVVVVGIGISIYHVCWMLLDYFSSKLKMFQVFQVEPGTSENEIN